MKKKRLRQVHREILDFLSNVYLIEATVTERRNIKRGHRLSVDLVGQSLRARICVPYSNWKPALHEALKHFQYETEMTSPKPFFSGQIGRIHDVKFIGEDLDKLQSQISKGLCVPREYIFPSPAIPQPKKTVFNPPRLFPAFLSRRPPRNRQEKRDVQRRLRTVVRHQMSVGLSSFIGVPRP